MHPSNHYYGQGHIFARYCGVDDVDPPIVWGVVQHGWNPLHGHGFQKAKTPDGFANFVWSDAPRRRGQAHGWRDYMVIGSAWAYLVAMEESQPTTSRQGTIFYPFHGWEQGKVRGSHQNLISEIQETEAGPVTVCLYWLEFEDEALRRLYEDAGFRVICHGKRGTKRIGTDARFLYNQYDELSRHRRVASNRLSTAVFYGAAVGCEMAVYGDPMQFESDLSIVERKDHVQRLMPELHGKDVDQVAAAEVAGRELGFDRVVSPGELRTVFGWQDL